MKDLYCPMIHGGLNIDLKSTGELAFNQCCLSTSTLTQVDDAKKIWLSDSLQNLRKKNKENVWDTDCWQCERMEKSGAESFRTTLTRKYGIKESLSGPQRIDLLFDRSCNLACLYCGSASSTFWQKYEKDNKIYQPITFGNKTTKTEIYDILKNLDLDNIEQIQFCGGETLMGNTYIETAKFISEIIPKKAKTNFEIAFQTNGTQPWRDEFNEIFERFRLVKIDISLDCTEKRFEYSRWPASWNQVTENILEIREKSPPNVMFIFQEVATNMSLFYIGENEAWVKANFKDNKVSDPTTHQVQLAKSELYNVNIITQEYVDAIRNTHLFHYLTPNWTENPDMIKKFIKKISMHDKFRSLDWKTAYPEVAEFFKRYI